MGDGGVTDYRQFYPRRNCWIVSQCSGHEAHFGDWKGAIDYALLLYNEYKHLGKPRVYWG